VVNSERPIVEVRDLHADELPAAIRLLARGFRDEPLQIASLGPDPDRRHQRLLVLFAAMFRVMKGQTPLVALDGETMVGVTGVAPPGTCQPSVGQLLKYLPALFPLGLRSLERTARVNSSWGAVDPQEDHSHLGPLAVDAELRGRGIGSQILGHYCLQLNDAKVMGYLETDSEDKVRLYERYGFEVIREQRVIGVPNWFMVRPI
jgi:ribosomal protein S18 acetylase RimI-like enzyme